MKLPHRIIGLCATLSVLAAAPAAAFELVHDQGKVTLPATPERIVTYDLSVLDSLNALGVKVSGVPKSTYSNELAQYSEVTTVGSLFEPDYAVLKDLKPQLIFAGGRSQKAIPELEKIAPTAVLGGDPDAFLESFRRNNLALGSAFGKTDEASKAVDAIDQDVKQLQAANQGKTGAFLFAVRNNVMVHVPGDRFGYAYEVTGLKSVLPAKDPNAPAVPRPEAGSPEAKAAEAARAETLAKLAKAEPDWLIVLDRGAINDGEKTAADTLAKHPQLSQTRAYKEGRVVYVDSNGWYVIGGGLNNFGRQVKDLLAAMK